MNEWQNLTMAVLLVIGAEIANEMIIALFKIRNATTRFRIRLISLLSCFFVFLVLPLRMIEIIIPSRENLITGGNNSPYILEGPVMLASRFSRFAWITFVLVMVGIMCFIIMLMFSRTLVPRFLECFPSSDFHLLTMVDEESRLLGVNVHRVMISKKKCDAFVFGFPPSLAIGKDLLDLLDPEELRIVIRHELYHIKGKDTLLKPFFTALCILFVYNPMVWFLHEKIFSDRECCADQGTLVSSQDTRTFLSLLLKFHAIKSERGNSLTIRWLGATRQIDNIFCSEKNRILPVFLCILLTFSSLFVGGTQLFAEHYIEIGPTEFDPSSHYVISESHTPDYFLDTPLIQWYEEKVEQPKGVGILLQESDLLELLKASEFSENGVTLRLATLPMGRQKQFFREAEDAEFQTSCQLIISSDSDGNLFVKVRKINEFLPHSQSMNTYLLDLPISFEII
ncbi:MAG: M48 family metalloprotease [Theionarchaea archaeon]|nr:M48 family metalloprotease [Theionarchaea archaeon]